MPTQRQARVVVVGAGFGGFQVAQSLAGADAEVLLVDRNNIHTFVPLLYQVATAQIDPSLVGYPVRTKFRRLSSRGPSRIRFLMAEVTQIDFSARLIETEHTAISYDYLVLATGGQTQFKGVPGAEEFSFSLRSLDEAVTMRNHLLSCFELAAREADPERRRNLLTFVIVGGGATGVELAGALAELVQGAVRNDYPELAANQSQQQMPPVRIVLLQSGQYLLAEFPASLGRYTCRKLRRMGVQVLLNRRVEAVTEAGVQLQHGEFIPSATVIWTAGQEAATPAMSEPVETAAKQKLKVRPTLQLLDRDEVYAIGDVAEVKQDGKPLAGVAPEALQQGVAVARNIKRQLRGKTPKPFNYFNKGRLAIIGRFGGVGKIAGVPLAGFIPWLLWLAVHLVYLPGFRNRLMVLLNWLHTYVWGDRPVRVIAPASAYQRLHQKVGSDSQISSRY